MTNTSFPTLYPVSKLKIKDAMVVFLIISTMFVCADVVAQSTEKSTPERHDFARRGNHVSEMHIGTFIIVDMATSEDDAKKKSDQLKPIGNSKASYGYVSVKKLWYVYFEGNENLDEARVLRDKVRQEEQFKSAWFLTVH